MKCERCGGKAVIDIKRCNAAFCRDCFEIFFNNQVIYAIKHWKMFNYGEPVLVAVSGGKDSLSLWDILLKLGYNTTGFHIDLGIGEYSFKSREITKIFAESRKTSLIVVSLNNEYGFGIPDTFKKTKRPVCSTCGLIKRYLMNKHAHEGGYKALVTGHNLDDEAGNLLGSVLRWQEGYLSRQIPALPAHHNKLIKRVKPLHRLAEREVAAYAILNQIGYIIDECPYSKDATSILYKETLNTIEENSPGTKHTFYYCYLQRSRRLFKGVEKVDLKECSRCGYTTTKELCAFCRLLDEIGSRRL